MTDVVPTATAVEPLGACQARQWPLAVIRSFSFCEEGVGGGSLILLILLTLLIITATASHLHSVFAPYSVGVL